MRDLGVGKRGEEEKRVIDQVWEETGEMYRRSGIKMRYIAVGYGELRVAPRVSQMPEKQDAPRKLQLWN